MSLASPRIAFFALVLAVVATAAFAVDRPPDPWSPALSTRVGHEITRPLIDNPTAFPMQLSWGESLLLLEQQLVIGSFAGDDDAVLAPVSVWQAPVGATGGDPGLDAAPWLGWRRVQDLYPLVVPGYDGVGRFGAALAGDDVWLFVGAPGATVAGAARAGAIHVYRRALDGAWTPHGVLLNPLPVSDAMFGAALDFDGTTLLVGVPGRRTGDGSVVVGGADRFHVADAAIGPPLCYVAPSNLAASMQLGRSVAIEGNRFAIGDPNAAIVPRVDPGLVVLCSVPDVDSAVVFVESILTSPTFQPGAGFGTSLDMDGDRLVVAAPGEANASLPQAGAVHVYQHDSVWHETHTIHGDVAMAQIDRCVLNGDVVAVGAKAWSAPDVTGTGRAWLYQIENGVASLRAAIDGGDGTAEFPRIEVGRTVALGHGRCAIVETIELFGGKEKFRSVRILPATSQSLGDCDGQGDSNLAEVLAGAADCDDDGVPDSCGTSPDCDGNGVPDACDVAWVPSFELRLPVGSAWWGLLGHGPFDQPGAMLIVCALHVPEGTDGVLRGVTADWIAVGDYPQPCSVAIYDDPNQDGDPSDAVLRGVHGLSPSIGPGLESVELPPLGLGPAGTSYFVGLAVARYPGTAYSMLLVEYAGTSGLASRTFAGFNPPLALNFEHPAANDDFGPFFGGDIVVGGLFRPSADLDGNRVPDACACASDLDGDGIVGSGDLGVLLGMWGTGLGDLDGDGLTGPSDIAVLLGAWGPC